MVGAIGAPYHTTVSWLCYDGYVDPPKRVSHSLALLTRFDVRFDSSPYSTVPSKTHKMVKKFTYPPERYQHIETIYIYHHISPYITINITHSENPHRLEIHGGNPQSSSSHVHGLPPPGTSQVSAVHTWRRKVWWPRKPPGGHLVATWWPPGGHLVLLRWFLPLKQLGKSYPLVN